MYRRRDVANFIFLLGFLVLIYLTYHTWLKPKAEELARPPSRPTPARSLPPSEPPPVQPVAVDVPELQPDEPEDTYHTQTLASVHDLIEREAATEALSLLEVAHQNALDERRLRPSVAILWNNLGVLQSKIDGPAASISAFENGLILEPESPALNLNLAQAYWQANDPELTREFLEKLVALLPNDPFPHLALADQLYSEDDLDGAARHLETASALAQSNPGLGPYLRMVTARIKGAEETERTLLTRKSSHFIVKFDGSEDYAIWHEVLSILENAYREIGQKLNYFPSEPIRVVLMTRKHFHASSGTPAWADALYNPLLGRITVPTQGALTDREWLTRVLRHEYVHALMHVRMGVQARKVPAWLNEGLAIQLAGDYWPDLELVARGRTVRLLRLRALHDGWGNLSGVGAIEAYLQSSSATGYLIERYRMSTVSDILDLIKTGYTMEQAVHKKLMISYDTFERRWVNELKTKASSRQPRTYSY